MIRPSPAQLAALLVLASPALATSTSLFAPAQTDRFGPIGGEQLLSLAGAIAMNTSDFDGQSTTDLSLSAQAGVGYFLTDVHELGVTVLADYTIPDEGDDSVTLGLAPYYNYNIRSDPRTWFYFGAHAGYQMFQSGDFDENGFAIGAQVGMRKWLGPRTAFYVEPRFTYATFSDLDFYTTQVLFGYSFAI